MFAHQIPPNTPLYNIFNQQQQQQHQYYQHVLFNQQNQNFIPNTCTQSNNQISVINPNLMYNNIINNDFNTCNAFNSVSNNNSVIDNKNCFQPKIKHVILVNSKCKQAKKSKWTNEEDELLRDAVHEHGEHSWKTIATMVPGRNSKQCRDRWTAQLNPCLTREEWSSEEDCVLLQMHTVHGNLWAKISTCLQGRSSSAVKNRYNWLMRRNMPQRMMSSFNHPYIGSVKASTESKNINLSSVEKNKNDVSIDNSWDITFIKSDTVNESETKGSISPHNSAPINQNRITEDQLLFDATADFTMNDYADNWF